MNGIIVVVAAVVVNFCLRIQIRLSVESVDTGVISTIAQLYSIPLSTLLSIDRQQLSLFDANSALMVTSSPFTMYLVFSSICDILGFETGLFRRIQSHRSVVSAFGALLLPVWFGLRLTTRLSSKAFQDSGLCGGFWIAQVYLIVLVASTILVGSMDVIVRYLIGREGASGPWERLCNVWVVTKGEWNPTSDYYEDITSVFVLLVDSYWATSLIVNAFIPYGKGYKVSYGQLLALFTALPPLLSTVKVIYGSLKTMRTLSTFLTFFSFCIFCILLVVVTGLVAMYYDNVYRDIFFPL